MSTHISVIIPNRDGQSTIGKCLESIFSSPYDNYEVIVVDDSSRDDSVKIIEQFPCTLIKLVQHCGASTARNRGAEKSNGKILFFTDADCLIQEDTLEIIDKTFQTMGKDVVLGGTYTRLPYDSGFFSLFQSAFIHYSETKHADNPDYVAAHAMALDADIFRKFGGFKEDFLPIIEDVEFSHRLRRSGYRLIINPKLLVTHIFNFSLLSSLLNAFKKSFFWTIYSLKNRDIFADSGTASVELKTDGLTYFLNLSFLILWVLTGKPVFFLCIPALLALNIFVSRRLFSAFYETKGMLFAFLSGIYYFLLFPLAVGSGAIGGILSYFLKDRPRGRAEKKNAQS